MQVRFHWRFLSKDKVNIFNRYFNSVYTKELLHNMPTLAEGNYPDMPEIEITLDGVVSLLQKLKPFKACGPDQIPNRMYTKPSWVRGAIPQ